MNLLKNDLMSLERFGVKLVLVVGACLFASRIVFNFLGPTVVLEDFLSE